MVKMHILASVSNPSGLLSMLPVPFYHAPTPSSDAPTHHPRKLQCTNNQRSHMTNHFHLFLRPRDESIDYYGGAELLCYTVFIYYTTL